MNKLVKIFLVSVLGCFVFLFFSAYTNAQGLPGGAAGGGGAAGSPVPPAGSGGDGGAASPEAVSTGQTAGTVTLTNPLGITDPNKIIGNVIKAVLGVVGSLALAVFIFGGFTWVISAGNEEKIKKGKDMILWASLGLAVIFFSYAIISFVLTAIGG